MDGCYRRLMSGKLLEFPPRRQTWNRPQPKLLSCSFCCFFTYDRADMDRHVNKLHTLRLVAAYDKTKITS